MIRFALIISYFALSFVVSSISYPIWYRWDDISHLRSYVLATYLLMSVIVTLISVLLTPILTSGLKRMSLWGRVSLQSLLNSTLLLLLALYLWPYRMPLPSIRCSLVSKRWSRRWSATNSIAAMRNFGNN